MIVTPEAAARRRREAIVWGAACLTLVLACAIAILFALQASSWLRALTGGGVA